MPELKNSARDTLATSTDGAERHARRRRLDLVYFGVLVIALASALIGACVGGRAYVMASFIVVLCSIAPLFIQFERRRPQAREIVLIAVMCALAVAARAAFVWLPNFKPMAVIVMLAGMALGASSGFLVGSVGMLVSNFIFGQGPWLPWQMLSYGSCGFVFGALAETGAFPHSRLSWKQRVSLSVSGALYVIFVAGPILDTSSLFFIISSITPESALAIYLAGFPVNCMQGVATFIMLMLLSNPILDKLHRVCEKYGLLGR